LSILTRLQGPADLRGLSDAQLAKLAAEIRATIVDTVARTGGHLGSSLGVVELTIALHRLLESPRDRIVWDTGHQAYPHKLLIVLNDKEMSISPTVGAFSHYLSQIKLSSAWQQSKTAYDALVERIPVIGPTVLELSRRLRKSVVNFAQPGQLFEDLGITYIGVVPGHDIRALIETFGRALALDGPVIVHVRTQKGHGYRPAERDQVGFHGAALPPMSVVAPTDGHDPKPAPVGIATQPGIASATNGTAAMPTESMSDDAAPANTPA